MVNLQVGIFKARLVGMYCTVYIQVDARGWFGKIIKKRKREIRSKKEKRKGKRIDGEKNGTKIEK